MNAGAISSHAKGARIPATARLFLGLLSRIKVGTVVMTTPEGETLRFAATAEPQVDITLRDWSACRAIMNSGDIGFAESYRDGKLECDVVAALLLAIFNQEIMLQTIHGSFWGTLLYRLKHLLNRNTRTGSRKNIHAHYDIGNDFYRLWLDDSMTYSSALFEHGHGSLEESQYAKYERLLEQLQVKPGDHLLEIGCGWGALAEYAARTRGCKVTAISLSQEQLSYARARIKGTPIESQIEFLFRDYRDLSGQYDAIVSIEMLEAVGETYWPSYFRKLRELVKPGGRMGLQTITMANEHFDNYRQSTDFIQQYIFPGGMLPSPARLDQEIAKAGLMREGFMDFGPDYAETLRQWRHRFEARLEQVYALGFDEAFVRLWRFYLCYCEAGFVSGRTGVCQIALINPPPQEAQS